MCGQRRIKKALSDYLYPVEYLLNRELHEIHSIRLKLHHDRSLDTEAVILNALFS